MTDEAEGAGAAWARDLGIELGPRMADLVRRTPLDADAEEQIAAILDNPGLEDLRKPLVSVALMNCLDRRVAEHEAAVAALRELRAAVEKAAKGG